MNLALLHLEVSRQTDAKPEQVAAERLRANRLLEDAKALASELGDSRTTSYALGYQAALYEDEGRVEEALHLTDRAILQAEQIALPEAAYRWYWRRGRLLERLGRPRTAIDAYADAVDIVQAHRTQLAVVERAASRSFREGLGAVYFDLVDVLLREAAAADPHVAEELRRRARDVIELQKTDELRDYFEDDCVDAQQARVKGIAEVSGSAAVIYPIVLDDRLELLLMTAAAPIVQVTVDVDAETLRTAALAFRSHLEERLTRRYLRAAQRLYAWLIAPIEEHWSDDIDTLVFVPDGALRTIPLSALHDGEHFLIERFAVAVTPGMSLTDPRPVERDNLLGLLAGLSKGIDGFPPLSHVPREIESIREMIDGTVLLDETFRLDRLTEQLDAHSYGILHIATHAKFESEFSETYLLTYDGKVSGEDFGAAIGRMRFRDEPLELLTLSACETGRGDERAALGLAGIAIRAGARSAIGTLWMVNDQATGILMAEFYRHLLTEQASRAAALQKAQLLLLSDLRFEHPGYWSPFLMINNWL